MQDKIWTLEKLKEESNLGLFYRRNNPYLIEIDRLLKEYEAIPKELVETEVNALLLISNACRIYIDRRPASHRGGAVLVLYTQTIHRANLLTTQHIIGHSLGHGLQGWARARAAVKPLLQGVAGSNGKAHYILDENYWPEIAIENHFPLSRPTFYGPSPMALWKNSDTHLNFIDWLREYYIPHLINQGKGELLWERLSQGVSYLDSIQRADK